LYGIRKIESFDSTNKGWIVFHPKNCFLILAISNAIFSGVTDKVDLQVLVRPAIAFEICWTRNASPCRNLKFRLSQRNIPARAGTPGPKPTKIFSFGHSCFRQAGHDWRPVIGVPDFLLCLPVRAGTFDFVWKLPFGVMVEIAQHSGILSACQPHLLLFVLSLFE